jgi:sulfate adenylyltransferase
MTPASSHPTLIDRVVPPEKRHERLAHAVGLPSIPISERSLCDLELIATGGFSPLDRFVGRRDYESILERMRLEDGTLFPIPVTLPIAPDVVVHPGMEVALRNRKNDVVATMVVEEIYEWDRRAAAQAILGTEDPAHPLVAEMALWGSRNISGPLQVLRLLEPFDFKELRRSPREVREALRAMRGENVVAFQTRNPMHRVHEELTRRAMHDLDAVLLLHPVVGLTKPGDVDHYTRVRTYKAFAEAHPERERILLSLLPLAMRMAGPREALWHAIIRRNYGASHLIIGRDHASPGTGSDGSPFWGPWDAQELVERHAEEIGITPIPFGEMVYVPGEDRYEERSRIREGTETWSLSGTELREKYLATGTPLPEWFTRPQTAAILAESSPPKTRQGVCVWFTGLSGAGKSTTAEILVSLLLEHGRQVTLLDGDVVRTHLSRGLGFSKEDRDTNILRIGFVASEIVRHGGVAVCAAVSPYRSTRSAVRNLVGSDRFVEVFVDTPIEVCESRDSKGLYEKARQGLIRDFTGVNDPYEAPVQPELTIESVERSAEENARRVLDVLEARGFVQSPARS